MKKKTIAGLIAIAAIVVAVIFAGCVEESSFPVEYPVTAYLELELEQYPGEPKFTMEMTLYKNGTVSGHETCYRRGASTQTSYYDMKWTIRKETPTSIKYTTNGLSITLLSDHDALGSWDIEPWIYTGYWLTG